ncbi:MAG: hypothetical protein FJZ08_03140 [Candidatus Omnitrophica bacterium]|nr:hypothetical protein [Candidatus Omnitrophota bacterium]
MNQANFSYYNINFSKGSMGNEIYVNGEIKNNSTINYSMVVFKVILYIQSKVAGSGTLKIAGLQAKGGKNFEAVIEGLHTVDDRLISKISRCDILFENGY